MTRTNYHRLLALLITVCIGALGHLNAQISPFDLKYRMEKSDLIPVTADSSDPIVAGDVTISNEDVAEDLNEEIEPDETQMLETTAIDNEMTVDEEDDAESALVTVGDPEENTPEETIELPFIEENSGPDTNDRSIFLFLMLIAATILTTLTIASNKNLVNNILRAVLNDNYLNLMYREHKKSGVSHYYILYFVFAVNAGLFLYFILSNLILNQGLPLLWRCVLLVAAIYLARHLFMNYLSSVYPFQKELEQYTFTILIFNIFLGLVLLPINVFVAFSPDPVQSLFLYAGIGIACLVYIFRQLRGAFIGSRLLINNKFYFLLYLCAVEIAPLLFLVKYAGAYVS